MREVREVAEEYLGRPSGMCVTGVQLCSGGEAFVLVRAPLGEFSLQLLKAPNGEWAVAAELDAEDYFDAVAGAEGG